jgi:hypothetical protein
MKDNGTISQENNKTLKKKKWDKCYSVPPLSLDKYWQSYLTDRNQTKYLQTNHQTKPPRYCHPYKDDLLLVDVTYRRAITVCYLCDAYNIKIAMFCLYVHDYFFIIQTAGISFSPVSWILLVWNKTFLHRSQMSKQT